MAARAERLPYGIGRFGAGWYLLIVALLAVTALGVVAYARQLVEGEIVTGLRDIGTMGGAAWGLYVVFVVYFVGVSFAGITIAAIIRLLDVEHLKPVARMAELLTIFALILASFSVLADLGNPLRGIVNLFRYARPQSPFFGTFSLVLSGYLFASLVYLYLDGRRDAALCAAVPGRLQWFHRFWAAGYRDTLTERARHRRASFYLAIAILPLLVTAHSTLGFVFGLQIGRPGWFSALQAPGFVVLAGISGIGLLIIVAAIFRAVLNERQRLSIDVFRWLGNVLLVLTVTYLYFVLVDWLTTTYQGQDREARLTAAMLTGRFAWVYWLSVASLGIASLVLFGQFVLSRYRLSLIVASGLLVNVAAVGKRLLIVVPSQIEGSLLPYQAGTYSPTWIEYSVILGLFGLGTLLYVLFIKVFPVMELPGASHESGDGSVPVLLQSGWRGEGRRIALTIGTVVTGIILQIVTYLYLAAPWGFPPSSPAYSNPTLEWSPAIFVAGVMLVFLSAVIYELLPDRENRPAAPAGG